MPNIYFSGSIRGGRDHVKFFAGIIKHLKKHGKVLTDYIATVPEIGEGLTDEEVHEKDLKFLTSCDVVVADVSTPSLGVGYEIGRAVEKKKKVLCLYKPKEGKYLSGMIGGCPDVILKEYRDLKEAEQIIDAFFCEFPGDEDVPENPAAD
jgi:nucleoside 2-deoxyribosyltransferase